MADFFDNTAPDGNSAAGPAGRIRTTTTGIRYPIFDKTISDNYIKARREYELNWDKMLNEQTKYWHNLINIITEFEDTEQLRDWYENDVVKRNVNFALSNCVSLHDNRTYNEENSLQILINMWMDQIQQINDDGQVFLEGGKKLRKSKKQSSKKRRTKIRR